MALLRACGALGIQQACTSLNSPKGQAETARLMRLLKEECLWRSDWTYPFEMVVAWGVGSPMITCMICTYPCATKPPGRWNGTTAVATALSSSSLVKRGASLKAPCKGKSGALASQASLWSRQKPLFAVVRHAGMPQACRHHDRERRGAQLPSSR